MEKQSELRCIYKGEYTVYQREAMYCFFKGRREQQTLSLEESLAMGGIYLFCPGLMENGSEFSENAIQYLKRWNRKLLFLWIQNPWDSYFKWRLGKLEQDSEGSSLVFERYRLFINRWKRLFIRQDNFVLDYGISGGYGLCSGNICMLGGSDELSVGTLGDSCGALCGELFLDAGKSLPMMEELDAGIKYAKVMENGGKEAKSGGFLTHAVSRVMKPSGSIAADLKLTPQALLDVRRTRIGLEGNHFCTMFATDAGKEIKVRGKDGAALVFQQQPVLAFRDKDGAVKTRKRLYLGLEGEFAIEGKERKMLCGLSGTENIMLGKDGILKFTSSMPGVYPYGENDRMLGTASWVGSSGGGVYYCQPVTAALYGALQDAGLRYLEIPAAEFVREVPPVPVIPFREIQLAQEKEMQPLEEGLYQRRREVFKAGDYKEGMKLSRNIRAVTHQGLLAEVSVQGTYQWIGFADMSGLRDLPDLRFTRIGPELQEKFLQKEFLYAVLEADELQKAGPSEGFCFSVEGIRFRLLPEYWRGHGKENPTMLFFKYSGGKSIEEDQKENRELADRINKSYTENGELKEGYETFIRTVKDPEFQGILAVNAAVSMDVLPPEVKILMQSVETDQFYASYLVIHAGQIYRDENQILFLEQSKVSGLIDYSTERKLVYEETPPDYDYLTREIRIILQYGHIVSFTSSSEILINRLFEAPAYSRENPDGNCLVLNGRLVNEDGVSQYQYRLKQCVCYQLSASGIQNVWIREMNLNVGKDGAGFFTMDGVLSCRRTEGADLLGYGGQKEQEGLPFTRLGLSMAKSGAMTMEYGLLGLRQTDAIVREGSFQSEFALSLDSILIEKSGKLPEKKGFLPITGPISQGIPKESYQGFVWNIRLGSLGGLSGEEEISIQLLTAFWPGEKDDAEYYLGIRLPGLQAGDGISLQGIFQLGFGSVSLEEQERGFVIRLHNFQIKLLGASFPKESSDIFLFSDGNHVGWYAAYRKEEGECTV